MPENGRFVEVDGPGDSYFDLGALSYEQFIAFFFDRPVVSSEEQYELFRSGIDYFETTDPAAVVRHMRAAFRDWAELVKIYSYEQVAQGSSFGLFGVGIECHRYLLDPLVDQALRIECVECMYFPFADVVRARKNRERPDTLLAGVKTSDDYYMWWDQILFDFWLETDYEHNGILSDDRGYILDTMHRTLSRILQIDDWYCQVCALLGLGHSKHPLAAETVQQYLNANKGRLAEEDLAFGESCRDGTNL